MSIPSAFKAFRQGAAINLESSRPLANAQSLSIKSDEAISPCVVALLKPGSPLTICWFVTKIVVEALNRMFRSWALPHVLKEVFKAVKPAVAYCDATPSVIMPAITCWPAASIYHSSPDQEFGSVRQTMLKVPCSECFAVPAAATSRVTAREVCSSNSGDVSAFAQAFPSAALPVSTWEILYCGEVVKLLAGKILKAISRLALRFGEVKLFHSSVSFTPLDRHVAGAISLWAFVLLMSSGCSTPPPAQPPPSPAAPPVPAIKATPFISAPRTYSVQLIWAKYTDPTANSIEVWQGSSVIQQLPTQSSSIFVHGLNYRVQYFWHLTASGPSGQSAPSATVGYWKQNAQQPGIPTGGSAQ